MADTRVALNRRIVDDLAVALRGDDEKAPERVQVAHELFGGDFFLEVSLHVGIERSHSIFFAQAFVPKSWQETG